ncbi:MAG TPA: short chain dehydrogenase [Nitrospira sp.]|nr:short chain dehydrogenase [Nitrospira sp.]
MRILVIGATGTIGRAVVSHLKVRHEVIQVSHSHGDYRVDLESADSIRALYDRVGSVDAVVAAAGTASFKPLDQLSDEDFSVSLRNKLMGQVNLVRLGQAAVRDGGSFTLTSGVLARHPMPGSAAVSIVNAGIEAFVRAAALELPRGIRINAVSPPWVRETLIALGMDPSGGMPADQVGRAYLESVEGRRHGEIIEPHSEVATASCS